MKCFLIMPPWTPRDVYTGEFSNNVSGVWPPIGHLCSLAATLLARKNDVEILDGAFIDQNTILSRLTSSNAKFAGLYVNAFLLNSAIGLIDRIKKEIPDINVGVGGPLASAWGKEFFNFSKNLDVVFVGEADYSLPEYIECLKLNGDKKKLEGIVFKKDGEIHRTKAAAIIENLNDLPFPARHLIDNKRYTPPLETYRRLPVSYIMSSRGCTNRCLYCFQITPQRQGIRFRSADNVLAEIDECVNKYKIKEIRFFDDNFAYDLDRVNEICKGLIKAKYDLTWYCSSRVDNINISIMKMMKKSGCWGVLFGAESGVQKNLDTLRKNVKIEQTQKTVREARKAGLKTVTPFIFGIPGETFEDGLKTIEFACKIKPFTVNFHSLTPFPGTELFDNIDKYGKRVGDYKDYTFEKAVFIPHTMTQKEIIKLRELAFKKFFSRPTYILMRIISIRTYMDVKILFSGFKAFLQMYKNRKAFDI